MFILHNTTTRNNFKTGHQTIYLYCFIVNSIGRAFLTLKLSKNPIENLLRYDITN